MSHEEVVLARVEIHPPRACQVHMEKPGDPEWELCVEAWQEIVEERAYKARRTLEANSAQDVQVRITQPMWQEGTLCQLPQLVLEITGECSEVILRRLAWSMECIGQGSYLDPRLSALVSTREKANQAA